MEPTFAAGTSIDAFLSTFLPPGDTRSEGVADASDTPNNQSTIVGSSHTGDHAPLQLPPPCDGVGPAGSRRRLLVGHLVAETRMQRDERLRGRLEVVRPASTLTITLENIARRRNVMTGAPKTVFGWENRKASPRTYDDPLEPSLVTS